MGGGRLRHTDRQRIRQKMKLSIIEEANLSRCS